MENENDAASNREFDPSTTAADRLPTVTEPEPNHEPPLPDDPHVYPPIEIVEQLAGVRILRILTSGEYRSPHPITC